MRKSILPWCITITISIIFCTIFTAATGTSAHEATKIRTTAVPSPTYSYSYSSATAFALTSDAIAATSKRSRGKRSHRDVVGNEVGKTSFLILSSLSSFKAKNKTRMNMYSNRRNIIKEETERRLQQQQQQQQQQPPPNSESLCTTNNPKKETIKSTTNTNRRNMLAKTAILVTSINAASVTVANAACLSGDTSSQCIGVYKMPIDDRTNVYIETPEQLAKYAPDVNWVPPVTPPKSYKEARSELNELQINCFGDGGSEDIQNVNGLVLKGQLEKAGIELLRIVPRITVVGRVIIGALYGAAKNDGTTSTETPATTTQQESLSMRAYRAEVAYDELLGRLGEVDVLLGQALRGQLGVSAAAQIQILAELKEAKGFLDDFVKAIPDDFRA